MLWTCVLKFSEGGTPARVSQMHFVHFCAFFLGAPPPPCRVLGTGRPARMGSKLSGWQFPRGDRSALVNLARPALIWGLMNLPTSVLGGGSLTSICWLFGSGCFFSNQVPFSHFCSPDHLESGLKSPKQLIAPRAISQSRHFSNPVFPPRPQPTGSREARLSPNDCSASAASCSGTWCTSWSSWRCASTPPARMASWAACCGCYGPTLRVAHSHVRRLGSWCPPNKHQNDRETAATISHRRSSALPQNHPELNS